MGLTGEPATEPRFEVVVNSEGQYSIWPEGAQCPLGWFKEGTAGPQQLCLDHIERVWTDMRPRSLREHMDRIAQS